MAFKSDELDYINSLLKKPLKKEEKNLKVDSLKKEPTKIKEVTTTTESKINSSIAEKLNLIKKEAKISRCLVHVRIEEPLTKWIEDLSKQLEISFSKTINLVLKFAYENYQKNNTK